MEGLDAAGWSDRCAEIFERHLRGACSDDSKTCHKFDFLKNSLSQTLNTSFTIAG
jgi:hypothetical protein